MSDGDKEIIDKNNSPKAESPDFTQESHLELSELNLKDRIKADIARQMAYMADMSIKEKISYFLYYYKWKILLGLVLIVCLISIPVAIYRNSRPIALSYAVINNNSSESSDNAIINEYLEYYNLNDGYQVHSDNYFYLNLNKYESGTEIDNTNYEQFLTLCSNDYFDILISDRQGIVFLLDLNMIQPIDDIMNEPMLAEFKQKYPDRLIQTTYDSDNQSVFYIDISKTDFAESLNLSYNKVYLCFPSGNDKNIINARRIIKFIFNLNSEIK